MNRYSNRISIFLTFAFIPLVLLWNPSWFSLMGISPYWPLFWLLPWAILYGPRNGVITGFCIGLVADSLNNDIYSQIPGLIICGYWFGRIGNYQKISIKRYQYGLEASIGSLVCGLMYFIQLIFNNLDNNHYILLFPFVIKTIFSQVFLTGLFAPVFCSLLYLYFSKNVVD